MPVDPRVGRMILAADENGVLAEVLPIAAALEIQDPRDRPQEKQQAADEAHAMFSDPQSDFLSYLRLWRYYEQARSDHSRSKLTRVLATTVLVTQSNARMVRRLSPTQRNGGDIATQMAKSNRKKIGAIRYADDRRKLSKTTSLIRFIKRSFRGCSPVLRWPKEKNEYTGAGGLSLYLWPGSGSYRSKPKWIVAAELVETAKQYARTVARIQPQWLEQIGSHLLKRSYSDPHWSAKTSGAFCYERVSLFGLPWSFVAEFHCSRSILRPLVIC